MHAMQHASAITQQQAAALLLLHERSFMKRHACHLVPVLQDWYRYCSTSSTAGGWRCRIGCDSCFYPILVFTLYSNILLEY
jgi:hypothetical protein